MSFEPFPKSLDVFHWLDPAVKGENKVIYYRAVRIYLPPPSSRSSISETKPSFLFSFSSQDEKSMCYSTDKSEHYGKRRLIMKDTIKPFPSDHDN